MSRDLFASVKGRSGDRSQRSVWHPSRMLVEESVLCGLIVAAGVLSLYSWLPRSPVRAVTARALEAVRNPFSGTTTEPAVALVPASRPMIAAIRRAEKLEHSGCFDQTTRDAWKAAAAEMHRFAFLPISTGPGTHVRLFMQEAEEDRTASIVGLLEDLLPGRFAALEAEREAAIAADPEQAASLPEVTWFMVAAAAPEEVKDTAYALASLHDEASHNAAVIAKYRAIVGYDHWNAICDAGTNESGFLARAALWRAGFEASQARFELAKATFEQGFQAWHEACASVPRLETDARVADEMAEHHARYREVLASLPADAGIETTLDL